MNDLLEVYETSRSKLRGGSGNTGTVPKKIPAIRPVDMSVITRAAISGVINGSSHV